VREDLWRRLLQVFQGEHAEHQASIRECLEQASQRPLTEAELTEAFRRAHSLKGAARAVDLALVETLGHHLESLLSRIQQGQLAVNAELLDLMREILDLCEDAVQAMAQQQAAPDAQALLAKINAVLTGERLVTEPVVAVSQSIAADPLTAESADAEMLETHPLSSATQILSSLPKPAYDQVRISARRLETLRQAGDRLQIESQRQYGLKSQLQKISAYLPTNTSSDLHTLVRESLRFQDNSLWKMEQELSHLQDEIKAIHMIPARTLFDLFPSMLRKLASDAGKEINSHFSGLELEVDRAVLQALKDPVMHILRNAVAHGIEKPELRLAQGKTRQGQITCQLTIQGQRLQIDIRDDGQGLHMHNLPEQMGTADAEALIFQAGFSTAEQVSSLSGRGMGLSVVADTLSRLQGRCQLVAHGGPGLQFRLDVPLQIVSTRLLVLTLQTGRVALPAASVEQIVRLPIDQIQTHQEQPVFIYQEQPVALLSLSRLLQTNEPELKSHLLVLVLKAGRQRLALHVEQIVEERSAVLKPLTGPATDLNYLLGAIVSLSGHPIPVLDPHYLVLQGLKQEQSPQDFQLAEQPGRRILVVDDSITTRTLEKSILESQGFQVLLAVDGVEAFEKLQQTEVELVITDVQMPRMNGIELLRKIRLTPHLLHLPVIVVTSLNHPQERQQGLELGADAYLVKQDFTQQELLEVIGQLI